VNDIDDNAFIIAALRAELAETIAQRDEVAQTNQRLLESHRRVYLATKPVLDAVKNLRDVDRADPLAAMLATADLLRAYATYNPPRELEVYK
jgi:hypothetical protein